MNLNQELEREHSRRQADRIAAWAAGHPTRLAQIFEVVREGPPRLQQRAAWALSCCCANEHAAILPHLTELIRLSTTEGIHEAISRNTFKILEICPLPEELHGQVYEAALAAVQDAAKPAAVKAYAISVLRRLTDLYPELLEEVRLALTELRTQGGAAVLSRLRKEFGI